MTPNDIVYNEVYKGCKAAKCDELTSKNAAIMALQKFKNGQFTKPTKLISEAIIEAKKFNATNAIMIVHSFSKEKIGFEDYSNFASLFRVEAKLNRIHFAGNIKGTDLYLGWVMDEMVL